MNIANGRLFPGCDDFYCLPHFESFILKEYIFTGKACCRQCNNVINEDTIKVILGPDEFNKAKQEREALE